jgi:hypothetical protein
MEVDMPKKISIGVLPLALLLAFVALASFIASRQLNGLQFIGEASAQARQESWTHPESLDAVIAAPNNHRILLENDRVRVLEVIVPPHRREPVHTHRWASVLHIDMPSRIRYYNSTGRMVREGGFVKRNEMRPTTLWMNPEEPHAVENISDIPFHAIRVELKR